jgi:carboxyl-terminal processing protease
MWSTKPLKMYIWRLSQIVASQLLFEMIKHKLALRTTVLAIATALFTGISLYASKSWARLQTSPKELVDEVWQILEHNYVDGTFNHYDWQSVRQEYLSRDYSSKQQAYKAIHEMVAKLGDPYTEFLDPQEYQELNTDTSGKFTGVGIELTENQKTKALTVVAPIQGTPAKAAGILPNDVIVKINGQATYGMNINEAANHILAPVGTHVVLTIQRGGKELNFKLTTANIDLHPVSYHTQITKFGLIGYIYLSEFTETAPAQMHQAIAALENKKVKGYILDLRSDPGGLLDASLDIANMWLQQGTIVSLVDRSGVKESYIAHGQALTHKPLVVLVDAGSASASEILSAALQDNGRATLVGTRTFGKGLVQSVQELEDGSGLKLTIAKYYTPKNRDINKIGIEPNVVVGLTDAQHKALLGNQTLGTPADAQYALAISELTHLIHPKLHSKT